MLGDFKEQSDMAITNAFVNHFHEISFLSIYEYVVCIHLGIKHCNFSLRSLTSHSSLGPNFH